MDRDTCVSRMQDKLGFGRTDLTSKCIAALQDTQDDLESSGTLPFWLLQQDQTLTITPPVPAVATPLEVALPAGFIREPDDDDGNLRWQQYVPGPQVFLTKMDYKEAEIFFFNQRQVWWEGNNIVVQTTPPNPSPGVPKAYVLRKSTIRIYPGPDKVYNLTWSYYAHDSSLVGGNVTNGWTTNAPWKLIGEAGIKVAHDIRNADAYSAFQDILEGKPGRQGASARYLSQLYEREVAGRNHAMGARL